jgi:hypothetical protein
MPIYFLEFPYSSHGLKYNTFLQVTTLEEHSEITLSLNVYAVNLYISEKKNRFIDQPVMP